MAYFVAGGLLIALLMALGTYLTARHYLVQQRERTAERQAFANAAIVRQGLLAPGARVTDVLGAVSAPAGSAILVQRKGRWFSSSLELTEKVIPADVSARVRAGSAVKAWTGRTHPASIVVGLPLSGTGADYYEVAVARELDGTLRTVRDALAASAGLTLLAGVTAGMVVSRRALTPLHDVTVAAGRISTGDLGARLEETDDPDLGVLVDSFNDMVDALDRRIRRDARFAADIAHELRSPMTTLATSVSVVCNDDGLPPRARQATDMMVTELERFRQSLDDLLEIGSLEAGLAVADLDPVDLRVFLRNALEATGRPSDLLHVEPAGGDDGSLDVLMDRRRLARAFVNLFVNADRHGGGLHDVRVPHPTEGWVEVWVEDRGAGVPPQEREHVFERFARAGSRGSHSGTGLGLSIVAETVHLHGGSVWCTDAQPHGARFGVRLPLVQRSRQERFS
jgi:two-component system sensor histidine kinase MtrB